jgi:hypothetical protein
MCDNKPICSVRRVLAGDVAEEEVLGVLDEVRRIHQVVFRIQIEVDDMIAEGRHVGLAARRGVTVGERRPHVRREEAQDVVKRDFVVIHLVEALRSGELIHGLCGRIRPEILMPPRVGANLMASSVHALDDRRIA